VRRICCETGFLGDPIEPLFADRELFADYLTSYYTDYEPEACLVAEAKGGGLVGYLIASRRRGRYRLIHGVLTARIAAKGLWRLLTGRYSRESRRFLYWSVLRGWREVPRSPAGAAHFHLNVLPGWRQWRVTLELLGQFREDLKRWGVRRVYGQMILPPDRRPARVFERFGWKIFDTRRVTKFREHAPGEFVQATIWATIDD